MLFWTLCCGTVVTEPVGNFWTGIFIFVVAVIITSFSLGCPNILPIPYWLVNVGEYGSTPLCKIMIFDSENSAKLPMVKFCWAPSKIQSLPSSLYIWTEFGAVK